MKCTLDGNPRIFKILNSSNYFALVHVTRGIVVLENSKKTRVVRMGLTQDDEILGVFGYQNEVVCLRVLEMNGVWFLGSPRLRGGDHVW